MKSKFLILALITIIPSLGFAAVFGDFEYTTSKSGVTITKYNGASDTVIVIPSKINNVPVRSIGASAFSYCSRLTSITIPSSVRSIGDSAFAYCDSLTSVTIPNSVTSIGAWAFALCEGLTIVTIPNSVTSIGESAFYGCTGLTSITIPNSVTSIGVGAFSECYGLLSIDVDQKNVRYKSVNGVLFNKALTTIIAYPESKFGGYEIPCSVTSIEAEAFSECYGLTSVTIPNSVKSIGFGAFSGCNNLTSVTIPNSVTSIGVGALEVDPIFRPLAG